MADLASTIEQSEVKTGSTKIRGRVSRLWEVDSWRGIAITTMVIYHLMWDLKSFAELYVVLTQGFWFYFQRFTATSFILLVGISLVISYNRAKGKSDNTPGLYWKFFRRGLKILAIAMGITVAVRVAGVGRIDFGVLHLIGTSILLAYPFLRYRWFNLLLGAGLIAGSYYLKTIPVNTYAFVWLGLEPPNYFYLDYFPLVHWFGVVLIGIFIGNSLFPNGQRRINLPDWGHFFPFNLLQFLGRHSLLIYVIHQPLLIMLLLLTGVIGLDSFGF
jgi:uncharacterized membrane protein